MGNFYTDVIQSDFRFYSTEVISDLSLLEPNFLKKVQAILAELKSNQLDMMVFETYRSKERQQTLGADATRLKNVSVHHFGLACDIVYVVDGKPSWDGDFKYLGESAHRQDLIWGGDWKRRDFVHLQWCGLDKQNELFAGTWYPEPDYNATKGILDIPEDLILDLHTW